MRSSLLTVLSLLAGAQAMPGLFARGATTCSASTVTSTVTTTVVQTVTVTASSTSAPASTSSPAGTPTISITSTAASVASSVTSSASSAVLAGSSSISSGVSSASSSVSSSVSSVTSSVVAAAPTHTCSDGQPPRAPEYTNADGAIFATCPSTKFADAVIGTYQLMPGTLASQAQTCADYCEGLRPQCKAAYLTQQQTGSANTCYAVGSLNTVRADAQFETLIKIAMGAEQGGN